MQTTLPLSPGALREKDLFRTVPGRISLAISASAFVAIGAHLSVPLPFTPVPFTLGNLAVLLVALALGPATAFSALVLYVVEGACGLPVFSQHGPGGLIQLFGPTGGYIFSYPFAAALASYLVRRLGVRISPFLAAGAACTLATLIIFIFGAGWLAHLGSLSPSSLFYLAVAPFVPGEIVKIVAASGIYSALRTRPRY